MSCRRRLLRRSGILLGRRGHEGGRGVWSALVEVVSGECRACRLCNMLCSVNVCEEEVDEGIVGDYVNSLPGVVVVQDDLYDFTGFEHDLVGVGAIDCCVRSIRTCRQNSVERRHFRSYVCYVIEESTIVMLVK